MASSGLEIAAGNTGKALDAANAVVTSPEYLVDVGVGVASGIVFGKTSGKPVVGPAAALPEAASEVSSVSSHTILGDELYSVDGLSTGGMDYGIKPVFGANTVPAAATTGEGALYVPSAPLAMRKFPGVGDVPMRLPEAEGLPHSVLGGKLASDGQTVYRQTATFDGGTWPNPNGIDVPWGRVDWTSHPYLPGPAHPNPHIHEFVYDFKQGQWRSTSAKPFFGH